MRDPGPGPQRRRGAVSAVAADRRIEVRLSELVSFWASSLRNPLSVGGVFPSSRRLAEAMVGPCDFQQARTIVEFGPGTGAITQLIVDRLHAHTTFLAMELDQSYVSSLRRRFPGMHVYHDCAESVGGYLARHGRVQTDCVISGLPWVNMSGPKREAILQSMFDSLAPGGLFTTFGYLHALWLPQARAVRRWLDSRFARVERTPVIWRNLPPAFVYRCWKAA